MNATDKAKLELAQAIGEDPDNIRTKDGSWTSLMRSGVIVNIHIRRWRARAKLDLADLGLYDQNDKELTELINLGEKYLLPPSLIKELDSIETSARATVEKYAFKTFWGFFIPENAYPAWKKENQEWKDRYYRVRDRIDANYYSNLDALLVTYRRAAMIAYQRIKALTPDRMTTAERLDEQIFANRFVGRLRELIPSQSKIFNSFDYVEELNFIPLPSLLAEDYTQAERIRAEYQKEADARYDQRAKEIDQRRFESEMMRDVMDKAAAQKQELIDGFLYDILAQLRGLVYEASTEVLTSIKRNGNLQPRSVIQIRNLVEQVNALNFFGDRDTERMIAKLQAIINQNPDLRKDNIGGIEQTLRDIATLTRSTLINLGEQPRTPKGQTLAGLGLTDNPPATMIRKARCNLEIETKGEQPILERKARQA